MTQSVKGSNAVRARELLGEIQRDINDRGTASIRQAELDELSDALLQVQEGEVAGGEVCRWWQQDEGYDTFSTSCGHEYTVNDCTDGNVQLPFCPFCARRCEGIAWHEGDGPPPLDTTPPAPVADAVRGLVTKWREAADETRGSRQENDAGSAYDDALDCCADDLEAALAAQPVVAYSIDADPDGIRERVASAITGALMFGAQGVSPPPEGHWRTPLWSMAPEERAAQPGAGDAVRDADSPEPGAPWRPINECPWSDDLFWFARGDNVDGPRTPEKDDADYWDYFAECTYPSPLPDEEAALAAQPCAGDGLREIPLNDAVRDILGRPCFTLIGLANSLRAIGHSINHRAEDEQAACLHWMLNLYLQHGNEWMKAGNEALTAAQAQAQGGGRG